MPGVLQRETTLALVRRQLEVVVRLGNELVKLGVIRAESILSTHFERQLSHQRRACRYPVPVR